MGWRKTINQENDVWVLSTLLIFFTIFGYMFISPYLLFISGLYGVFLFLNSYYDKHTGEKLLLKNEKRRFRYFQGDKGELHLHFKNEGLPIINGQLEVYFNKNISLPNYYEDVGLFDEKIVRYKIPFTIKKGQELKISVPFIAEKRGYGRVTKIVISHVNLFGFSKISLEYIAVWNEEYFIYPKIIKMNKNLWLPVLKEGSQITNHSLFNDRLLMAGTRDYIQTDSFQSIHWKASAKLNRLQTKQYEKITDSSLLIVLNVAESYWWNEQIEDIISRLAYITEVAYKENIPVGLITNIKTHGTNPFLFVPIGEGSSQFAKILEMLAVIDTHQLILPYEKLLYFLQSQRQYTTYMLHAGHMNENQGMIFRNFSHYGTKLYKLQQIDEEWQIVKCH